MLNQKSNRPAALPLLVSTVALGATIAAYTRVFRPWYLHWGANEQEEMRVMPGDEFVPHPRLSHTRAITINAPIEQVWQWIAQIGQARGGLYSYEALENFFGGDGRNAERIIPEFQNLQVGDAIPIYPNGPSYAIAEADAPRTLLLRTFDQTTGEFTQSAARDGVHGTWVFYLEPRLDQTTRLIARARLDYEPSIVSNAMWGIVEPVEFLMGRKTLLGIKARAEAHRVPDELLDSVLPEYEFRGVESIKIHAKPARIFQALKQVTLADMPLAAIMGELRYLPGRLSGHTEVDAAHSETFMDGILRSNLVLAEEPDRELIIGCIGKFHDIFDQQFVRVHDTAEFERFLHADYQKLAMSLRVSGDDPAAGVTLTLEYRTHAMSEHARKQFARYWLAIKPTGGFVSQQLLHAIKHRAEALAKQAALEKKADKIKESVLARA